MKSSAFEYSRPGTVAEAVGLLAGSDGNAMPICGGQSLLILMGLRFAITGLLVDISRLEDLRRVDHIQGATVGIVCCRDLALSWASARIAAIAAFPKSKS